MLVKDFFDRRAIVLGIIVLVINSAFFFLYEKKRFMVGILVSHGEIAYNVYAHNSVKVNKKRLQQVNVLQREQGRRVEFAEIDHSQFGEPTSYRSIHDTVGYGVVLGLLWKLTGSLRYRDIQLLQIVLSFLCALMIYHIAFFLFGDVRIGVAVGIMHCLFLPLRFFNVIPFRDIWAFYALVIFLFGLVSFLKGHMGKMGLVACSIISALFQCVRPNVVFSLVGVTVMALVWSLWKGKPRQGIYAGFVFLLTNILFFWVPFTTYNRVAYGQYFVGISGIPLIEGLGEYENPWGLKCSDDWYSRFMKERYGVKAGTPECERKGKELFFESIKQYPWVYVTQVVRRIPRILFPTYYWFPHVYKTFINEPTAWARFKRQLRSLGGIADILVHGLLVTVFFLAGYMGIILAFVRKQYLPVLGLFVGGIVSNYGLIFAHFESRHILHSTALFSFFGGYFFCGILIILYGSLISLQSAPPFLRQLFS